MIEVGRLYIKNSNPLEEVLDKERGHIYYTVEGHAVRYISKDEFEFIEQSPLNYKELIFDLTAVQLKLFWNFHKHYDKLRESRKNK